MQCGIKTQKCLGYEFCTFREEVQKHASKSLPTLGTMIEKTRVTMLSRSGMLVAASASMLLLSPMIQTERWSWKEQLPDHIIIFIVSVAYK